jgi:hypothetical protein
MASRATPINRLLFSPSSFRLHANEKVQKVSTERLFVYS